MTLKELTYSKEKAIIINCGTHLSTTLAILSVLRYCKTDLVVLNCQMPTDLQGDVIQVTKPHRFEDVSISALVC